MTSANRYCSNHSIFWNSGSLCVSTKNTEGSTFLEPTQFSFPENQHVVLFPGLAAFRPRESAWFWTLEGMPLCASYLTQRQRLLTIFRLWTAGGMFGYPNGGAPVYNVNSPTIDDLPNCQKIKRLSNATCRPFFHLTSIKNQPICLKRGCTHPAAQHTRWVSCWLKACCAQSPGHCMGWTDVETKNFVTQRCAKCCRRNMCFFNINGYKWCFFLHVFWAFRHLKRPGFGPVENGFRPPPLSTCRGREATETTGWVPLPLKGNATWLPMLALGALRPMTKTRPLRDPCF